MLVVPGALALALLPDASRLAMRRTTPSETRSAAVSMAPTGAPKVVVTGVGVVSALGSGDEFWEALLAGESGVDTITAFDASKYPTTIGAECKASHGTPTPETVSQPLLICALLLCCLLSLHPAPARISIARSGSRARRRRRAPIGTLTSQSPRRRWRLRTLRSTRRRLTRNASA